MLTYADALELLALEKEWDTDGLQWKEKKSLPVGFEARSPLSHRGITLQDTVIIATICQSKIIGLTEKISFSLIHKKTRILGVDAGCPSTHRNKVGQNMPYYHQSIGQPHIHLPVEGAPNGYVEPLELQLDTELWQEFLRHGNIKGAPNFEPPETLKQGRLL